MRLLNTTSFILEEFTGREIPQYAILSHRWGNQEISFQDIQMFKNFTDYFKTRKSTKSEGWSKIKAACEQAVLAGCKWIWVDSCCIDKTSSAELSEAINSMFLWYRDAVVCYAYLPDVFKCWGEEFDLRVNYEFRNSKWFGRGWTLQELLAPKKLIFFNRYWLRLGDRKALWTMVSQTTGIKDEVGWASASVAQKMSWASKRETTRVEDRAYSLMGLFDVNMPPLYGEGENAFIRLQLEILRISDDESIFAWRDPKNLSGGLLARSPNAFQESGDIERFDSDHYEKPPYSMTNKGLRMEFPLLPAWRFQNSALDADDTSLAPLQCRFGGDHSRLALLLRCIKGSQFRRI
ncbi:heterokaryon incompatibility protein-domain-containing protein, partial [Amylocarpus encephaloides]